jgi:hypothetical protein
MTSRTAELRRQSKEVTTWTPKKHYEKNFTV